MNTTSSFLGGVSSRYFCSSILWRWNISCTCFSRIFQLLTCLERANILHRFEQKRKICFARGGFYLPARFNVVWPEGWLNPTSDFPLESSGSAGLQKSQTQVWYAQNHGTKDLHWAAPDRGGHGELYCSNRREGAIPLPSWPQLYGLVNQVVPRNPRKQHPHPHKDSQRSRGPPCSSNPLGRGWRRRQLSLCRWKCFGPSRDGGVPPSEQLFKDPTTPPPAHLWSAACE